MCGAEFVVRDSCSARILLEADELILNTCASIRSDSSKCRKTAQSKDIFFANALLRTAKMTNS